jgi:hypothetical protein
MGENGHFPDTTVAVRARGDVDCVIKLVDGIETDAVETEPTDR